MTFDPKAVAFTPEAVDYFVRLGMLKRVEAEKLQRLTTGELKEMGGRLPDGYVGVFTVWINMELDAVAQRVEKKAIKAYLKTCVQTWREKRDECPVPIEFLNAWETLTPKQQFAFMATFYVDAFQAVCDTIFDELIREELG